MSGFDPLSCPPFQVSKVRQSQNWTPITQDQSSTPPRAVLVGWDTLDVPTYRHRAFAAYQSGRQFDAELRDQLDVLPHFVNACGFVNAKSPGYEADDFLAAAVASEELRGGKAIVATGDRDAFQLASEMTTILQPVRAGGEGVRSR